jgi:hypothetical protein
MEATEPTDSEDEMSLSRTSASSTSTHVTLKSGLTLPADALRVLWNLEARGVSFEADDDVLVARPLRLLTDADHRELRRYKWHILALLDNNKDERWLM